MKSKLDIRAEKLKEIYQQYGMDALTDYIKRHPTIDSWNYNGRDANGIKREPMLKRK